MGTAAKGFAGCCQDADHLEEQASAVQRHIPEPKDGDGSDCAEINWKGCAVWVPVEPPARRQQKQ